MHKSVHVRFPDEQLLAIDNYRRARADIPTTPKAVRDLVEQALATITLRHRRLQRFAPS